MLSPTYGHKVRGLGNACATILAPGTLACGRVHVVLDSPTERTYHAGYLCGRGLSGHPERESLSRWNMDDGIKSHPKALLRYGFVAGWESARVVD